MVPASQLRRLLRGGCARGALLTVSMPASLGIVLMTAALGVALPNTAQAASHFVSLTSNPYDLPAGSGLYSGGDSITLYGSQAGAPWTVTNEGTIANSYGGAGGIGIQIYSGTITNSGSIGSTGYAISIVNGGRVTNTASGVISGAGGIQIKGAGTIDNAGRIVATGAAGIHQYAVSLFDGGTITNEAGGLIQANGGFAVYAGAAVNITNSGTIQGLMGLSAGIFLQGGTVKNATTASRIAGAYYGIESASSSGAVTVVNYGTITSPKRGVLLSSGGTLSNLGAAALITGTAKYGVEIAGAAGMITNQGTITGAVGVDFYGAFNETLINSGTIIGTGGTAVRFGVGNDQLVLGPGAVFAGIVTGGAGTNVLELAAGAPDSIGTIGGIGTSFTNFGTVKVDSGAYWTLTGTNTVGVLTDAGTLGNTGTIMGTVTVTGAGSVVNAGRIAASGSYGIEMTAGGSVTNTNTASSISGANYGVKAIAGTGTVVNYGTISGPGAAGVYLTAGGIVTNSGAAARISGQLAGVAINGTGTVMNDGIIDGGVGYGVNLIAAGSVTNTNTGLISGQQGGVKITGLGTVINSGTITGGGSGGVGVNFLSNAANTLINSGTIIGTGGTAVRFAGGNDLLVLDPGAVFTGIVAGAGGTNILELAAGMVGSVGTVSGIGTSFTNFGTVKVDAGADWTLIGTNTLSTFTDAGTLNNAGTINATVSLAGAGLLNNENSGTISGSAGGPGDGMFATSGTAGVAVTGSGTLTNEGLIIGGAGGSATDHGGNAGAGVTLASGASVDNSGTISGGIGGAGFNAGIGGYGASGNGITMAGAGAIYNSGTIMGGAGVTANTPGNGAIGIAMATGGTLTNTGSILGGASGQSSFGTGIGGVGVTVAGNNTTIFNSGTIRGGSGADAIDINGTNDRLILQAGFALAGAVVVTGTVGNTLELASNTLGNVGTISGLGTSFVNFGTVTIDSSAEWTLTGTNTAANLTDAGTLNNAGTFNGTVTVTAAGLLTNSGTIAATGTASAAVRLASGGSVTNMGTAALIIGGSTSGDGIDVAGAAGTIANAGTISGRGFNFGVYLKAGGNVTNSGTASRIDGTYDGVRVSTLAGMVTNEGTISGTGEAGIYLRNGGTVTNSGAAALISGPIAGAAINGTGAVANDGTIIATGNGGNGVNLLAAGNVTNNNTGLISGQLDGVIIGGTGTVTNSGTITGTGTAGIGVRFVGNVANTLINSGTIIGAGGTAVQFGADNDLLELLPGAVFSGTVTGGAGTNTMELAAGTLGSVGTITGIGTSFTNFGTVTVDSGAAWAFTGANTVGTLTDAGTLTNSGTISVSGSEGVQGLTGAGKITNTGTILGTTGHGISLEGDGAVSNLGAGARIAGTTDGIDIVGTGTVINQGTIVGSSYWGVATGQGSVVKNSGTAAVITGSSGVFFFAMGGGTLINDGAVTSTAGNAVDIRYGGIVTNNVSGTIAGTTGIISNAGVVTVTNAGTIIGRTGPGASLGLGGTFDDTLINSGTIGGAGGTAVQFGAGNDLLQLKPGASFTGLVDGAGGTNMMELATGAGTGSLTGLGTSFTNFGVVTVDTGANWTFTGQNTVATGVTLTNNGTLANTGTLTANGAFYNSGSLINSGSIHGTVTLTGAGRVNNGGAIASDLYGVLGQTGATGKVTNSGTIAGTLFDGIHLVAGGNVANNGTSSSISGGSDGVYISGAVGTVSNAGTIAGYLPGPFGVGIEMRAGGVVKNQAGATITAYAGVVVAGASGTVTNAGTIEGAGRYRAAIYLADGGGVTNDAGGEIRGGQFGVRVAGAAGAVTNAGAITGTGGYGVELALGGTVANQTGGTIAGYGGVVIVTGLGTVTNAGVINATATAASNIAGAKLEGGGTIDNLASGSITGVHGGVAIAGAAGTVINFGTIAGTGTISYGVALDSGGTIKNETGSLVTAATDAIIIEGGNGAVTNAGTIRAIGMTGQAVLFSDASGTISNTLVNTGLISGVTAGIRSVNGSAMITNRGTVQSTGTSGTAIDLTSSANGTIDNFGSISSMGATAIAFGAGTNELVVEAHSAITGKVLGGTGADNTIVFVGTGTLTNGQFVNFQTVDFNDASWTLGGSETLTNVGIGVTNGSLTNAGSITGTVTVGSAGLLVNSGTIGNTGTIGTPVTLANGGSLRNSGLVTGATDGVIGSGIITNTGTITASSAAGIAFGAGAETVSNSGLISGATAGILATGGSQMITNRGVVRATAASGIGIDLRGGSNGTIDNFGSISSTGATAIAFGAGTNELVVEAHSAITGKVLGGTGADNTIVFVGTGTLTNGQFVNFQTVDFNDASWTLGGSETLTNVGIGVTNGSLTNAGSITGTVTVDSAGLLVNSGTIGNTGTVGTPVTLANGGSLRNSGLVTGATDGVIGSGIVTNTGTITASGAAGIAFSAGADMVTNSGLISGATAGIRETAGSALIANRGLIRATAASGIGIDLRGGRNGTIDNFGSIASRGTTAIAFGAGTNELVVEAHSAITGKVLGGTGADNTIVFVGTGTLANGQFVNFQTVDFDDASWTLSGSETLTNVGIGVTNGSLTNAGSIAGTVTVGVHGKVINSGTVENTGAGGTPLTLANGGILQNSGLVDGRINGVIGAGTITNSGTIIGKTGIGVDMTGPGLLTNKAGGLIRGGTYGIKIGSGDTVHNAGTILDNPAPHAAGIALGSGASLVNQKTGLIGGAAGVAFTGAGASLSNAGTITGTSAAGIAFNGTGANSLSNSGQITGVTAGIAVTGGTALITNTGTIAATGASGVGVLFTGGTGTIDNFGTISGAGGTAVRFGGGVNELILESGGVLSGVADGSNGTNTLVVMGTGTLDHVQITGFDTVEFDSAVNPVGPGSTVADANVASGTLTNAGTLTGTITIAAGARLINNGLVTDDALTNDGLLDNGKLLTNAGLLTNNGTFANTGTVTNNGTLANAGSLDNTGTIAGSGRLDNSGTLDNSGLISGAPDGVTGGGTITNSGTIIGTTGTGVKLTSAGTLTNLAGGLIQGGRYGIQAGAGDVVVNAGIIRDAVTAGAGLGSGAVLTNQDGATIVGRTGVIFTGTGASLTDNGTITGTGGTAVQFGAGVNTLTLTSSSVLNGAIAGGGGAGQIALTGSGTLTNAITDFGAGSALAVESGAAWSATGTWRIASVTNAGTFQAGSLDAPLRLTGNFKQGPGGTLQVALDADGRGSKLVITGTASIAGKLALITTGTFVAANTSYTILTATDGVSGKFGQVTGGTALLTPSVTYGADDIMVTLSQQSIAPVMIALPSGTSNERSTAAGLDAAIAANPTGFAATLAGLDQFAMPQLKASLDRLSGEGNADLPSLAILAGEQFTGQIRKQGQLARLGDSGTDAGQDAMAAGGRQQVASLGGGPSENALSDINHPWGVWTSGYGQTGQVDGDGNTHSLNETIAGGAFGADYKLYPALRIGAALGYGRTTFSLDNIGSHGFVDDTQFALYADYTLGRAYLDGTVGVAFGDATTRRDVSLPRAPGEARGNSSSTEILGAFEGGYTLKAGTVTVTPFAGLSFGSVDQRGFAELGGGVLDLQTGKQTVSSVKTTLGARFNVDFMLDGQVITSDASVGWSHEFADIDRTILTAFSGAPSAAFAVNGAKVPRNSAALGLGLATQVSTNGSVYLHYDGDIAGSATSHAISAGFRYAW